MGIQTLSWLFYCYYYNFSFFGIFTYYIVLEVIGLLNIQFCYFYFHHYICFWFFLTFLICSYPMFLYIFFLSLSFFIFFIVAYIYNTAIQNISKQFILITISLRLVLSQTFSCLKDSLKNLLIPELPDLNINYTCITSCNRLLFNFSTVPTTRPHIKDV